MIQYLDKYGGVPFSEAPLNDVDLLIFTTLVYMDFQGVEKDIPLSEALSAAAENQSGDPSEARFSFQVKDNLILNRLCASCPRYRQLRFLDFTRHLDMADEEQFAAMALEMDDGKRIIVYRGTDNTLAGWKEDMNLAFLSEIPAQKMAVDYLEKYGEGQGKLVVCGHSKGGNLALYAFTKCRKDIQERVEYGVSLDGPGLSHEVILSPEFKRAEERMRLIMPRGSLVGLLFEQPKDVRLVASRTFSLLQHYGYTWKTEGMDFVYEESHSLISRMMGDTTRNFLRKMSPEMRERFVDAVHEILTETQMDTLTEMLNHWLKSAVIIATRFFGSDRETFQMFLTVLISFLKAFWEVLIPEPDAS